MSTDDALTEGSHDGRARRRVTILGGGRMARAMARVLSRTPAEVTILARKLEQAEAIRAEAPNIDVARSMTEAIAQAELIFFAVPAHAILELAELYGAEARGDHIVVTVTRGVGPGFSLPHEMIRAKTCVRKIGVLGGPLFFSGELDSGRAIAAVIASRFSEVTRALGALTPGTPIIFHPSRDVVGVEVASALSNVAAIAVGVADALELGETVRGLLLTHSLGDSMRLGVALGAEPTTFTGLAGVGELIPRRVSSTDRHRELGGRLARASSLPLALDPREEVLEGITTAREAVALARKLGIELPVARAVVAILDGEQHPKEALESVLRLGVVLDARPSALTRL